MSSGTKAGLILIDSLGQTDPKYNEETEQRPGYSRAKVDGSESMYIIYDKKNFASDSNISMRVDAGEVSLGADILSFQGYDKSGIVLFPHPTFRGKGFLFTQSDPDITDQFPVDNPQGVSSFMVDKGTWAIYSEKNYMGTRIEVDGKISFGPGEHIIFGGFDKVKSMKQM